MIVNVLIATSEYVHLAKAGGLADAVATLAEGLTGAGHTVRVVLPKYRTVSTAGFSQEEAPLYVTLGDRDYGCAVHTGAIRGVTIHLIEHEELLGRDGIYGPRAAVAYDDNLLRFALFSKTVLELVRHQQFAPDIVHIHDWPTALTAAFRNAFYRDEALLSDVPVVLSIHNLGFQGVFPIDEVLATAGMTEDDASRVGLLNGDETNLLKSAILTSDRIVTVSPTYAQEIQQPRYGFDLHGALQFRAPDLIGILNGIDTSVWNPDTDSYIPARYSAEDLRGKRVCKEQLQEELDLPVDPAIPLLGMVTRLTDQKGIDELFAPEYGAANRILKELPVQWVVLGTGEGWCEERIRTLTKDFKNFVGFTMYSETLAHRIEAGSDFFLMPSRYEPCGLNQMYSMRYGTIPIVTRTGGLVDTVDSDTGFHIEAHTPDAVFDAVARAVTTFQNEPETIQSMQRIGMRRDFSVDQSIGRYVSLYASLLD